MSKLNTLLINSLSARINTPSGLKKVKIEETPHYKLMCGIIKGESLEEYRSYLNTYFVGENFEQKLKQMKGMVQSFDWNKAIILIDNNNIILDGLHRTSLAKALGFEKIQTKRESYKEKIKNFLKSIGLFSPLYWYRYRKNQYQKLKTKK